MEKFTINHSLKDIPIPSEHQYLLLLTEKIEDVISRIRWKTYHFLNGKSGNTKKCYGFRSQKTPPPNKLLEPFEKDLINVINQIEFRHKRDKFQNLLSKEISEIRNTKDLIIKADKTRNLYKMSPEKYKKLLEENIKKNYKKVNSNDRAERLDEEAKRITDRLQISDRVEKTNKKQAFILLKDHKEEFETKPTARLINPTKQDIGKISKQILEKINTKVRTHFKFNQWINTRDAIKWFTKIKGKENATFIQFDIVEFYPSITEKILNDAIIMAKTCTSIDESDIEVIKTCKKSLLVNGKEQWIKTENQDFDVGMGSFDSAETSDIVGLFILYKLTTNFLDTEQVGLYRDDGLVVLHNSNRQNSDRVRKRLHKIFKEIGFKIETNTHRKTVNFLDVTLNLNTNTYEPYMKDNTRPLYVNNKSNHPRSILKQIPISVEDRITQNSSNAHIFEKNKDIY